MGAFGQITALILACIAAGESVGYKLQIGNRIRLNEIRREREALVMLTLRLLVLTVRRPFRSYPTCELWFPRRRRNDIMSSDWLPLSGPSPAPVAFIFN